MQREHNRPVECLADKLEVPSLDDRQYRVVRLPNQLEALLVHDPDTDKASAALDVNVGAFSDEKDMPGMAHAVEHLLFMGTKKFPQENDYNVYLSSHSGNSNAYTGACSTNYFFDISAKPSNGEEATATNVSPLHGGLDRFAQFFIDPLFLASTVDRELRAVDSENKKNLQADQWRLNQLQKSLSNPNHPYCHFSTGNFETLKTIPEAEGIDVRQKFIDFHQKHYSANRMKLCVLGREPLDVLEAWVADLFSGVPNKGLPQNRWEDTVPFDKEQLAMQCFAKPVMDSRELNLCFPFLDEENLYESQPSRYISHLIGHEGPGSIMSYIKSRGWANSLSAGAYNICPGTPSIFDVEVRLTKEGLKNYKEVVKVVFQYVSLLRQSPPQEWIFEEQKGMADVDFKFKQKTPASRFTSRISSVMQKPLPREWLLSGQAKLRKFDPEMIKKGVDLLRPDNLRLSIVSQDFPGGWDQKEKWYGTEYKSEKIPDDFLAEITRAMDPSTAEHPPALHLPHKNQFIPTKLEVEKKEVDKPALAPRVIRNDNLVRTWYKKDDTFWVPKANLIVSFKNPVIFASAENSVKSKLFTDLVRDALEEYSYDADLAGLQYNVSLDSRGLFVEVAGYNDKLPVLLEQVLLTMRDLQVKDDRFDIVKERLLRGYKNCELQEPFNQIGDYVSWLTSEHEYVVEQLVAEIPAITAESVKQFHKQIMSQLHIEAYVHGNLYKEDALKLTDKIESVLRPRVLPKEEWPIIRSLDFPAGSNYLYQRTLKDPANVNHCIEYYLHIGDKGDRMVRAKTQVLDQMLHEPSFDQLRTKEQLGYIVYSSLRGAATTYGFRFIIQSERKSEYLESRIDAFLTAQAAALDEMSDAKFESHKRSVINKRLEKLKNLDQETGRHWSQISNEYYDFEGGSTAQRDADQVKQLTKADMVDFYSTFIHPASPSRAKLVVQLIAQGTSPKEKDFYFPIISGYFSHPRRALSSNRLSRSLSASPLLNPFETPLELPRQLAAKTSSSKKRKISSRQSAPKVKSGISHSARDTPIQSCEPDDPPSFSFTSSAFDVAPTEPAYLRSDSLPPASSLPQHLQTHSSGCLNGGVEDGSSIASSPSAACADLSIHGSDYGADTPALEPGAAPSTCSGPARGSSPFTKTTHHRAIMGGGAAEYPERASSPLKRRASSMDPEAADQDAQEDVDMIPAPLPEATDAVSDAASHPRPTDDASVTESRATDTEHTDATENTTTASSVSTSSAPKSQAELEAHIAEIKSLLERANDTELQVGQDCYLVSRKWLDEGPYQSSKKHGTGDLSLTLPVDNSDIILEVIDDICVGKTLPVEKRKFVRLKPGYSQNEFIPFTPEAWELLMQWPGLKEGQIPIRRTAYNSSEVVDRPNIVYEFHPPVLTIYRIWSALSTVPVDASVKAANPAPPRLVRSRTFEYVKFLKQAKRAASIDLEQKVRVWRVPPKPEAVPSGIIGPLPPSSPQNTSSSSWDHLLLEVDTFVDLGKDTERFRIDAADLTTQANPALTRTLGDFLITMDQAIVLDPKETGESYTSTFNVNQATTELPTRNGPGQLTVQSQNARSGRASPVSQGPMTRGRTYKSGRTPGCVGLANLGNTCYMNAALQCLRSVEELTKYFLSGEWEHELNRENVLAHNGDVAAAYAGLLKDIYHNSTTGSVTPRLFKSTVGRYAAQFSGYGQQDSQEFLGFLLDGLQEDLSRIKKKPYIEKPDSTDEMINDPDAIRRMADDVWDITRKRDDSVIADLFTGLYQSTLVCPECGKVSITFDPFNNLTLQLPVVNKWNHTIVFFPLNDRPIRIRVELNKHDSIRALKEFISARTGVPPERLHAAEMWSRKFYKHYPDAATVSDEIVKNDHAWIWELEARPSNYPGKPKKQGRLGMGVRSLNDDEEQTTGDDDEAQNLLVPVLHRRGSEQGSMDMSACPHFIMVDPKEARNEDAIGRKVLEKVACLTKHPLFARQDDFEASDSTEAEMIGMNGSDTSSSTGGKVVAQSIKGEDDMVDVQMNDAGHAKSTVQSPPVRHQFNHKRPAWVKPENFLPGELQNLFQMRYFAENNASIPIGMNHVDGRTLLPTLASRAPTPDSPSEEEQFDNVTNGTASQSSSSSDEAPRRSVELPQTRMNDESDDEDESPVAKSRSQRPKPSKRGNAKLHKKLKPRQYGKGKGSKKALRQQRRQLQQEQKRAAAAYEAVDPAESVPDGGPLIRLREGIVVDWTPEVFDEIFGRNESLSTSGPMEEFKEADTLPAPDLDKAQEARAKRHKNGISLEECLDEFERKEILSEQDMWFCPRCKEHRRATKKLDLWKTPDILIMHLKRFSSAGFRRDKLSTSVDFPVENLDIASRVQHREDGKEEVFDLIGIDCHFGGLGGGHYTATAKNFVDGQWYSFNDSSVTKQSSDRIVDNSAYLLFYRRRSDVPLGGPRFREIVDRFSEPTASDDGMQDSGEDRRLGEGFSRNGSSSALDGIEANRQRRETDDDMPLLQNSTEDDEGIDLSEDGPKPVGFGSMMGSTWDFKNISSGENMVGDSPLASAAASDVAQPDSEGEDQALSPLGSDQDSSHLPGVSQWKLSSRPEDRPPPYPGHELENPPSHEANVVEVVPDEENERRSEDATEIHLDDDDKIKVM
ncbi:ubiquitin carboxyl-terminal hydrolase-like protein [Xylariaceae sp. FL0804]|nr:ubiquitin carboxyl-terminal hydrolase-like protein [Xylariaceae sp. FL0804]